ncbi:GFA family protein [Pseudooceanicola sp. LIPI14-2-Ac024]|uniref:GFA family protein n=1 Tax=Pseudooceanicola sp. LIPI14-2-Ac024 TaxID=3344875 RepID=UPI0035CF114A
MTTPYSGGCACGAVRYQIAAEPLAQVHCQCRECQRVSGTGHGSYLVFGARDTLTATGATTTWRVQGDSGNFKLHRFCPACGAPVFVDFEAAPDMVAVHPASLDDPARFAPGMVTYTKSAQPWDRVDPGLTACLAGPG